ncbi:MAG: class I SAM-dependent methyltransferase [Anaerolineae bacterium]|nr:class I SAM-dependent methyltransferase [Anaerolineae bacterium]
MNIYDTNYVEQLFDEMSRTYEVVNYLSSFGFTTRWRRQFVRTTQIKPGATVCDLMCGMGECWSALAPSLTLHDHVIALDMSQGMLAGAERRRAKFPHLNIQLFKQDILENTLPDACADNVICGFGLKTFTDAQREILAAEIKRLLKPRGTFAMIEISVPNGWLFKDLYLFYLKHLIPIIGRLLLGNPENYRMLGVYTEQFGDCRSMMNALARQGLQVEYHQYFYGCATGVSGVKP